MTTLPGPIVSTDWLAAQLPRPGLVVVDASWYLPAMNRDPQAEFQAGHLPGAVFWDIDRHSDETNPLPHMLPAAGVAAARIGALGIGDDDLVVVYDGSGTNLSAARVWWELQVFGHDAVAVLDGGSMKWRAEGRALATGWPAPAPKRFTARFRPAMVRSIEEVTGLVGSDDVTLVDGRTAGRFEGREPEPRPGIRGGHIPGARNVPYARMVAADGTLLPRAELIARFEEAGVDLGKPVVASCGSGVSACALLLGLHVIGHRNLAVYDGSWTEWGGRADTPVQVGG